MTGHACPTDPVRQIRNAFGRMGHCTGRSALALVLAVPVVVAVALGVAAPAMAEVVKTKSPLVAEACAGCHGQAGKGVLDRVPASAPRIAGYDRDAFIKVWGEFRANARPATVMNRIARGYTDAEIAILADYFAAQK